MIIPTVITTAPPDEPVTLDEVKTHLRGIDHNDHDEMLIGLIKSTRQRFESILGRALVQQTRTAYFQNWPTNGVFSLPYPALRSVSSIKYTDTGGTQYTWSADNYDVDTASEPGRVVLGYSKTWPTATLHHDTYPIEIEYVCGYAPTDDSPPDYRANVPETIKTAMKLEIELKYNMPPEGLATYTQGAIDALIMPYRVWGF